MRMQNTPINIRALLGKACLTTNFTLQVGDTIILDQKVDEPLKIEIEGQKRLLGYPGSFNHKKAVKISKL